MKTKPKTKQLKKVSELTLPEGFELIGVFKLKDKEGRRAIKLNLREPIKSVIIQKFAGVSNKIIVAVEKGEIEKKIEIIVPKLSIKPKIK